MVKIVGKKNIGKTAQLVKVASEMDGVIVCGNPKTILEEAKKYNCALSEENIYTYDSFLVNSKYINKPVYVDNVEKLITAISPKIDGYTYGL